MLRRSIYLRWLRRSMAVIVGVGTLIVLLAVAVQFIGAGAIGQERLRAEAERALTALAGFEVRTEMDALRLVLSDRSLVALEVSNLHLSRAGTGDSLIDADKLRFGFKLLPLLGGRIEIGSAEIVGARVQIGQLAAATSRGTEKAPWNHTVAPDALRQEVFDGLRTAYALSARTGTRFITLRDVAFVPDDEAKDPVRFDLRASLAPAGKLEFSGSATVGTRVVSLSGQALRPVKDGPIKAFSTEIGLQQGGVLGVLKPAEAELSGETSLIGALSVALTGAETQIGVGQLALDMRFEDAAVDLGEDGVLSATGRIEASIDSGADVIAIRQADLSVGRSVFSFVGAVAQQDDAEGYRFDLTSREASVAPQDSPEAQVPFGARIEGRIEPDAGRIVADAIRIVTASGQISASAAVTLEAGKSPGLSLAVYASGLPTSEVKQFWPWFAAPGARNWVLSNLFGGRVEEGNLRLRVPPGRLGDGNPLNNEEVSGEFSVASARFDVAGRIPPVRDAEGTIRFQGADVDISIGSGTIYMPSGRSVAAHDGTLTIRDAHIRPRIGKLEIDLKGEAPGVVELASYEPIDVSDVIDLAPDDVSGQVTGHVSADIPLSDGIPRDMLRWRVALDYDDLTINKPIDGQAVANAKGRVLIEPERAEISATANLNGIPAKMQVVEPLGGSDEPRVRDIVMTFDDKARRRLLPGLDDILAGPTEVSYAVLEGGRKKISVKLDGATLALPWLNWSKGRGIPATASFILDEEEDGTTLRDFVLKGATFGVQGLLTLRKGALASARFENARLNRGDDFSATIERAANGYAISVRGAALDARSVIKRYLDTSKVAGGAGEGGDATAITLDARLARLSGFDGETLRDVTLRYADDGRNAGTLEAKATTRNGGSLTLSRGKGGIDARSSDAGAVMRFIDFYPNMEGGQMRVALQEDRSGALTGTIAAQEFFVVNEPRLRSLVAAGETEGEAGTVDAMRVHFERGFANIRKGMGSLELRDGVLRGPLIGTTFQGTLFDAKDNISITGTFMPLYGLNRIFGEIPLFGGILGNGRDRGLIGITYRLFGKLERPELEVNPISAIAPGIFRQIFEFR
ncbi:DUF3971 domain-containing protein [Nitratireductor pacificus]|uniref:YhdP central domain-containing protein n=1 Tax=Nitratireductor pacificus pht-3B TaxID=391937 RepID=K2M8K2_9HYPH|nr:DUF3971 domain-containing protein [Nitratireductor pacificus]EKF17310.1 hypothetical protein NA2_18665 [Nitratireductor pacificus pht-3B]